MAASPALVKALDKALNIITTKNARGFFEHCRAIPYCGSTVLNPTVGCLE
jgi:hypothetical protein